MWGPFGGVVTVFRAHCAERSFFSVRPVSSAVLVVSRFTILWALWLWFVWGGFGGSTFLYVHLRRVNVSSRSLRFLGSTNLGWGPFPVVWDFPRLG